MKRISFSFLSAVSLSLVSVTLLFFCRRPASPASANEAPVALSFERRLKAPTVAIIDSGVPRDFDRTRCRLVSARDFTGEGLWDDHGHAALVNSAVNHVVNNSDVAEKTKAFFVARLLAPKTEFEKAFRSFAGMDKPGAFDGVNVISLKVIDQFGETTPVRILQAAEAVANDEVDFVVMSLNVWLPHSEADAYLEALAAEARKSRAMWFSSWPNYEHARDLTNLVAFPSQSPYVIAVGRDGPTADHDKQIPAEPAPTVNIGATIKLSTAAQVALEYEHRRGVDHLERREYDKSAYWLQRCLSVNLSDQATWCELGVAYKGSGDIEAALAAWQIALALGSKPKDAYYNIASALYEQDRYEDALRAIEEVVRAEPDYADAHSLMGTLLIAVERLSDGIEHYKRALELSPNNALFRRNLVRAYFVASASDTSVGRLLKAAASSALELDRAHPLTNMILGLHSQHAGDHERSIQYFTSALDNFAVRDVFDRHIDYAYYLSAVHEWLSESLATVGRDEEARVHRRKAVILDRPMSRELSDSRHDHDSN